MSRRVAMTTATVLVCESADDVRDVAPASGGVRPTSTASRSVTATPVLAPPPATAVTAAYDGDFRLSGESMAMPTTCLAFGPSRTDRVDSRTLLARPVPDAPSE